LKESDKKRGGKKGSGKRLSNASLRLRGRIGEKEGSTGDSGGREKYLRKKLYQMRTERRENLSENRRKKT